MIKTSIVNGFPRILALLAMAATLVLTGCTNTSGRQGSATSTNAVSEMEPLTLREGDTISIEFPGAPAFNKTEIIKRDGKISLIKGELTAAGKTIAEFQKELLELYKDDLILKAVVVTLQSSQFPIYITGAVGHSGRLTVDCPMTALEAVMEAGVSVTQANLKSVRVTRTANGKTQVFMLNLDRWLKGKTKAGELPFYVKPSDIIYVPEKFQWF